MEGGGHYLQLPQHGMVLDAREQDSHSVGTVIQVGDSRAVQVAGQLIDVCLELRKSCASAGRQGGSGGHPRGGGERQEETFVKEGQAQGVETGMVVEAHLQKGREISRPPFLGGGHVGDSMFYFLFHAEA